MGTRATVAVRQPETEMSAARGYANIVRAGDMTSEALARYIAEQTVGVLRRLADLRPHYEELWKRFDALKKGETIMGCMTKTHYVTEILGRSMRSIQYALYGRRPLKAGAERLVGEFVPREFAKDEAKWLRGILRKKRLGPLSKEEPAAPAPEPDFFPGNVIPGNRPPAADIKEALKFARHGAAKQFHPDNGATPNPERMAAMNAAVDWLESVAQA